MEHSVQNMQTCAGVNTDRNATRRSTVVPGAAAVCSCMPMDANMHAWMMLSGLPGHEDTLHHQAACQESSANGECPKCLQCCCMTATLPQHSSQETNCRHHTQHTQPHAIQAYVQLSSHVLKLLCAHALLYIWCCAGKVLASQSRHCSMEVTRTSMHGNKQRHGLHQRHMAANGMNL